MKKLFILLTLITVSVMATELRQEVMNKIRIAAQRPTVYPARNASSTRNMLAPDDGLMAALMDNDYTNAISRWLLSKGRSSNDVELAKQGLLTPTEETNAYWEARINTLTQEAEAADAYLKAIPPSTLIPLLFQILEEGSFGTNETVKAYCNWYEGDDEPVVFNYKGRSTKEKTVRLYVATSRYIFNDLKLETYDDWKIMAIWSKNAGKCESKEPAPGDFPFYWWYDGRKYATNIWNDFYTCWQYEQTRDNPRPTVLKELADEIACMGITLLPIVKDAIQGGDNTLSTLLESMAEKLEIGGITNMNYLAWYQQNGSKYELPACEGLEAAKLRIADTNYVNEFEGIFNFDIPGHTTVRTSRAWPGYMKIYADQLKCFYTNHPSVPDYWYYKLPDDVLEVDDNIVLSIDRNVTNYNPRFLTPSAE